MDTFYQFLCCPQCRGALEFSEVHITCKTCQAEYAYLEGKPQLIPWSVKKLLENAYTRKFESNATHTLTNRIDAKLPHSGQILRKIAHVISPPDPWGHYGRQRFISRLFPHEHRFVLDVGCGSHKFTEQCVGLDAYPTPAVDLLVASQTLPFTNACADGVVSCSLLEHVPDPGKVLDEMVRVLKPGGGIYIEMPFLQGYHPSPCDGQRYTYQGLERLLKIRDIQNIETGMCSGPSSALSYLLRNWLAVVFSFRSKFLFELASMLFGWLTFPLKYVDFFLKNSPKAADMAFGLYAWGEKTP